MADNRELHDRAMRAFTALVEPLTDEQWDAQTPCPDWKVKDLVGHVVGGNHLFAAAARGEQPSGDAPTGDLKNALADSAEAVRAAFAPDEVNDRTFDVPIPGLPAQVAIAIHTTDVVVHSWDLAKATGQTAKIDDDLVEASLSLALSFPELPEFRAPGGPFGPKVEWPDDAPALERLVAHLGRTP